MFINIPVLINDLKNTIHERFIMGHLIAAASPVREPQSKYFCPEGVYSDPFYPEYMSGTAYIMSGDLISELLHLTYRVKRIFHLEDVFLTGLLPAALPDVTHVYNAKFGYKPRIMDPCVFQSIITAHEMNPDDLLYIWNEMQDVDKDLECGPRISAGNGV